jgi:hypothetical protein
MLWLQELLLHMLCAVGANTAIATNVVVSVGNIAKNAVV